MKVSLPIVVVAYETDFGGVVSNTRYAEYLERGRYLLFHDAGLRVGNIWGSHGFQPVIRRTTIDYLSFARHEDELLLQVEIAGHSGATTTVRFKLTRPADGALIMRAEQVLAYLNTQWKPVRVPAVFRDTLRVDEESASSL